MRINHSLDFPVTLQILHIAQFRIYNVTYHKALILDTPTFQQIILAVSDITN